MEKNINTNKPVFQGTAPMWDDTPRISYKGLEYTKLSSVLFYKHLINIKQNFKKNSGLDFVYINSWNEWGEGAYLEPDEYYKYQYLEVIKKPQEQTH